MQLLDTHAGTTTILAGGQSLVPMMNERSIRPEVLIDINALSDLDYVLQDRDRVRIGALVRHYELESCEELLHACPLIPYAASHVGNRTIRSRGTVGGSLAHADPAAELPVVALLLHAKMHLRSAGGERVVGAEEFFLGPHKTALKPDEALTTLDLDVLSQEEGWGFREFARAGAYGWAVIIVAAVVKLDSSGRVTRVRIALGGVGPTPVVAEEFLEPLLGSEPGAKWREALAEEVASHLRPIDDIHASSRYRLNLVRALLPEAITEALHRCQSDKGEW